MAYRKSLSSSSTRASSTNKGRFSVDLNKSSSSTSTDASYEAILRDPVKRNLILKLLSQEKEAINDYLAKEKASSPLKKVKTNKAYCGSPSALYKKKLLMKQQSSDTDNSSSCSSSPTEKLLLPFDKLLEGVIAYVEVKTRDGDRSAATSAVVRAMGATVREEFTKDVTHVIFKDGSFTTYQKAKLLKKHLVNLLWVEAIKTNRYRVPEKNFPALGVEAFDGDMSVVCQQLQNEYQDALRDEYRRSIAPKTSQKKSYSRRKTALPSELASVPSPMPFNLPSTEDLIPSSQDKEVASIFTITSTQKSSRPMDMSQLPDSSPELTSDSSSWALINGEISRNIIQELELNDCSDSPQDVSGIHKESYKVGSNAKVGDASVRNILSSIENTTSLSELQDSTKTSNTSNGTTSLLNRQYAAKVCGINDENSRKSKRRSKKIPDNSDMEITANLSNMLVISERSKMQSILGNTEISSRNTTECEELSSLRLSVTTTDNNSKKNESSVNAEQSKTNMSIDQKQKRKSDSNFLSPPKQKKLQESKLATPKAQAIPEKNPRSGKRKFYDPSQSPDESILPLLTQERGKDPNKTILKKSMVVLTPILVTTKAKELLDKKNTDKAVATKKAINHRRESSVTSSAPKKTTPGRSRRSVGSLKTPRKNGQSTVINEDKKKPPVPLVEFKKPSSVTDRRRSMRISQLNSSKSDESMSSRRDSSSLFEDNSITPIKRRSTMDFVSTQNVVRKKGEKKDIKLRGIVCTRLHRPDVQVFMQIVKKLGSFVVEDEVTSNTTHLVAGEPRRTINLLRAIGRGCWIVRHEWIFKSLEAGRWLPEEPFELVEFSKSVQQCRIERQAFGRTYTINVFQNCGYIYVARSTLPRCSDLQELIRLGRGKVTTVLSRARIVVGEYHDNSEVTCVKEAWILDSITFNKLKPFKEYLMV